MTNKTKKTTLLLTLLFTAAGISFALYSYYKGPLDVKNSKGISVNANDLYSRLKSDTMIAGSRYTGKIIEVSGYIKEISNNIEQQQIILLKTSEPEAAINCTMNAPIEKTNLSEKVIIKGICSGMGQEDPDLGIMGDVYLTSCYVEKK